MKKILLALGVFLLSSACALLAPPAPAPTQAATSPTQASTRTPAPTVTPYPSPTRRATPTPEASPTPAILATVTAIFNPGGERVIIQTEDGQQLVGYYYIAAKPNSPVVVMMHQFGANQSMWQQSNLVPWIQNAPTKGGEEATPSAQGMLPSMPGNLHFNVLTFDFRGHGESPGERPAYITDEVKNQYILDAKAAYTLARTLPYADPDRIIGFGTSIGADAALDTCRGGCVGVFSISPGSYLGVDWFGAATQLSAQGKHIRCMYAQNDGEAAQTCSEVALTKYYRILPYPGAKHGLDFLAPHRMEPGWGNYLLEFLLLASET